MSIKLRDYRMELDMSLPAPLDMVGSWLLRTEAALVEEQGEPQDHGRAADDAREKQELLRVSSQTHIKQTLRTHPLISKDELCSVMLMEGLSVQSCRCAWRRCPSR